MDNSLSGYKSIDESEAGSTGLAKGCKFIFHEIAWAVDANVLRGEGELTVVSLACENEAAGFEIEGNVEEVGRGGFTFAG